MTRETDIPNGWGEIQPKGLPASWSRYRADTVDAAHIEGVEDSADNALVVSDTEGDGAYIASTLSAKGYLPDKV